jgi:FMN phosphatase YigB (HAD superfamily)
LIGLIVDKITCIGLFDKMSIYKTLLIDAIGCLINSDFTLNTELLSFLNSKTENLVLITNAKDENLQRIKDLLVGEKIQIFTKEFNPIKTDPKYFEVFLSEFNIKAEECFYIDHDKKNLESAKINNINGILFEDNSEIILKLKIILD